MTTETNNLENPTPVRRGWAMPSLLWAAAAMLVLDLGVFLWVSYGPKMEVTKMNSVHAVSTVASLDGERPSPLEVSRRERGPKSQALKLKPVLFQPVEPVDAARAIDTRGEDSYRVLDRQTAFPRVTATAYYGAKVSQP